MMIALAAILVGVATVSSDAPRTATPTTSEITTEQRIAVDKGLAWLAEHQADDGSYGNLSHYGPHVGITGLVGLAFMSDGSMPKRGRYGETVD